MLLHEREATRNQDFLQFRGFLSLNLSKKQQDPNIFLNVKIKDQVDYQIIAKDQWAMLAEGKKMRSYFEKKLCLVTSVRHYEIQQPDLITKNYFLKSRMILLS